MTIIYNISIHLFIVLIHIASLFSLKAKKWIKGRRKIFTKLSSTLKDQKQIVWFHCSSLGEFEQGKPIITAYKKKNPSHKILLTFFSPSGFEVRQKTPLADFVFYLPADTRSNARRFIKIVKPIKVVFIKYEFWFNYMSELKKQDILFYSVSAIFRKNQAFFKYRWWAKQLQNITHFFVQDKNSSDLLQSIGLSNITISGDSRFDTVFDNMRNQVTIPLIKKFCKDRDTLIFGSTWPKDEILLTRYINENQKKNYIIAPHELKNITLLQKKTNGLLFSNLNEDNIFTSNVLIIDSVGLLSYIYQYGKIAYVGGGFGVGIHNILEAVVFGLPVIFGPNYKKSKEAYDLIKLGRAKRIQSYAELSSSIDYFDHNNKNNAIDYIKNNCGATDKILEKL